jgi:cardiolipin synthase
MSWLGWPNRVTITRILLIAPLIICVLNINNPASPYARRLALGLLLLIAVGDGLDGFLARRLRQATLAGKFLDPLGDKILMTCMTVLLAFEATGVPGAVLPNWVPVIAIGKDVVTVGGFTLIYLTAGRFVIQPRPLGKACTVVQFGMIALVLAAPDLPRGLQRLPGISWWTASGLAVAATLDYLRWGSRAARPTEDGSDREDQPT